jgi:hypothetical protein
MRRVVLAWVVLGAACTSSTPATTTTTPQPVAERLVVLTDDSVLATMNADGSEVVTIVNGSDRLVLQPTWSPGGERLAWTEVAPATAPDPVTVVTALPDGSDRTRVPVGNPPFYLSWDPTGDRLALLRNGPTVLVAGLIDVAGRGDSETMIASGQPFYFAWDPTGSEILANIGVGDRLETISVLDAGGGAVEPPDSGSPVPVPPDYSTPLGADPGHFQAPAWVGDSIFWARRRGDSQELVASAPGGADPRVLIPYRGFIQFVANADGSRLAFRVLDQAEPAVTVRFGAQPADAAAGVLSVLDVGSGEVSVIDDGNPLAFLWSPDSTKLLYLSLQATGFVWSVWDGDEVTTFAPFTPSLTLGRDYLPFFDQFAQSIELWSPDSSSFVYSGQASNDDDPGIWVQPLDGPARRVADGVFAAFPPAA